MSARSSCGLAIAALTRSPATSSLMSTLPGRRTASGLPLRQTGRAPSISGGCHRTAPAPPSGSRPGRRTTTIPLGHPMGAQSHSAETTLTVSARSTVLDLGTREAEQYHRRHRRQNSIRIGTEDRRGEGYPTRTAAFVASDRWPRQLRCAGAPLIRGRARAGVCRCAHAGEVSAEPSDSPAAPPVAYSRLMRNRPNWAPTPSNGFM